MIVRSFLAWYDAAPMAERIEAVRMMAQCTLAGELGGDGQQEAESALTLVLDDPAISVRAALAWELALADKAPRHLILGLAHDQAEVAALVLARSPQLKDADLVECARHGEALTHLAIASRNHVPAQVVMALAETAGAKALVALLRNPGATFDDRAFRLILDRHAGDACLREALHQRADLPVDVRQSLIATVSRELLGFIQQRGWLGERRAARTINDAREGALITLASEADDLARFITELAASGQLTPSLLIRSLLTGDTSMFGAALVCLADVSPTRVAGMLRGKASSALAATCVRAGLPRSLVPVFAAALAAIAEMPRNFLPDGQTMHRPIINRVLAACLIENASELEPVIAALRRLDADMARAEARAEIERLKSVAPVVLEMQPPVAALDYAPIAIDEMAMVVEEQPVAEVASSELQPAEVTEPAYAETYAIEAAITDAGSLDQAISEPVAEELDEPVLRGVQIDIADETVLESAPQAEIAEAGDNLVSAVRMEEPVQTPINRLPPLVRVHDDLEALLEQLYAEERALSQALYVVDERPMEQDYFVSTRVPARFAA